MRNASARTQRLRRSTSTAAGAGDLSGARRRSHVTSHGGGQTEEPWDLHAATRGIEFLTLRDRVIAVLRSAIVLGYLEPGRIYPITWFEDRLRMGRTPIREGLLDLMSHGLIHAVRNRGYRVASLADPDVDEIFRLREALEVPAHAAAAERMDESRLRDLRDLLDDLRRAAARRDALAFVTSDREFHLRIVESGAGRWTQEFVSRLRDHVLIRGHMADALMRMNTQHAEMLDALERGGSAHVRELMTKHLRETKDLWLRSYADGHDDADASQAAAVLPRSRGQKGPRT